jgi:hypothetical protein
MNGKYVKLESAITNKIHCLLISDINHQKAGAKYHWPIFVLSFVTKEETNKHEDRHGFQNGYKNEDDEFSWGSMHTTLDFVAEPDLPP